VKLALFGGSFDPIHNGHLEVVLEASRELEYDKLIVMPAYLSPFKSQAGVNAAKRFEWARKVFEHLPNMEVSDFEISQHRSVPTIESVEYLRSQFGLNKKILLIIGADNLLGLPRWDRYERLLEFCEPIVATRTGYNIEHRYKILNVKYDISSTDIRNESSFDHLPKVVADEIIKHYKKGTN
jgi:nicotinate-nucleotide adenylyltransferase